MSNQKFIQSGEQHIGHQKNSHSNSDNSYRQSHFIGNHFPRASINNHQSNHTTLQSISEINDFKQKINSVLQSGQYPNTSAQAQLANPEVFKPNPKGQEFLSVNRHSQQFTNIRQKRKNMQDLSSLEDMAYAIISFKQSVKQSVFKEGLTVSY